MKYQFLAATALAVRVPLYKKVQVRQILEAHEKFDEPLFYELLTRDDADHLMLSDAHNLIWSMQEDYPDIVKVSAIGKTWQDRDIPLVTIDGYDYLMSGNMTLEGKPFTDDSYEGLAEEIVNEKSNQG